MKAVIGTEETGNGEVTLYTQPCMICQRPGMLTRVPQEGYERWVAGEMIQNALPDLSPSERELLMTGTHGECFAAMFPPGADE
jgi:hypothetical protein